MKLNIAAICICVFALVMQKSVVARKLSTDQAAAMRNMELEIKLMKAELKQLYSLIKENGQEDHSRQLVNGFQYSKSGTIEKVQEDEPSSQFVCPLNGTNYCINKLYPNEYDCTTYWSCSDVEGCIPFPINCTEPLEFSETEGACVDAVDSGCTEITRPPTAELLTTMAPTTKLPIITPPDYTQPPTTESPCPPPACFGMKVAFGVHRDEAYGPVNIIKPIVYTKVEFNIGGGFDPATSIFTAPASGYYNLYFHQLQSPDGIGVYISINGVDYGSVVDNNGIFDKTTTGVYNVELAYGDYVFIYLLNNGRGSISLCHFGGVLLFETNK